MNSRDQSKRASNSNSSSRSSSTSSTSSRSYFGFHNDTSIKRVQSRSPTSERKVDKSEAKCNSISINHNEKGHIPQSLTVGPPPGRKCSRGEMTFRAVILIQKWYRGYKTRQELRKITAWNIYQSIEYNSQQDQMKLHKFFLSLIKYGNMIRMVRSRKSKDIFVEKSTNNNLSDDEGKNKDKKLRLNQLLESNVVNNFERKKTVNIVVESSYDGPKVTFPITKQTFLTLVNYFKYKKKLHAKFVSEILQESIKELKNLKNINNISTMFEKSVTVVGDLHGQLDDLLMILFKNGLPSEENPYLFNGDFVDRGPDSIEVSLIILCGFLMNPNAVFINRGNHEDHVVNTRYGFQQEIMGKYYAYNQHISNLYNEVFRWLPLASLIDNQVLVVHGGISADMSLLKLLKIKREKYVSVLQAPSASERHAAQCTLSPSEALEEWNLLMDALWSDPMNTNGFEPNETRGGGSCFGPDVTKKMMYENKLKLIIRSHECKENGYEYTHNNSVLTIFSASNYYTYGSNKGAYAVVSVNSKPVITQFQIRDPPVMSSKEMCFKDKVSTYEQSAITNLLQQFMVKEKELMEHFKFYDKDKKGYVAMNDWIQIVSDVLNLKLPWRILRSRLVDTNSNGLVIYESTFKKLHFRQASAANDHSIMEVIYKQKKVLENIFKAIDTDNSGFISKEEFHECCKLINSYDKKLMLTNTDIDNISAIMDLNKDSVINLNEFLEAFRLINEKFSVQSSSQS